MTPTLMTRRDFLVSTSLVIGISLPVGRALAQFAQAGTFTPNAFVRIAPDSTVTVIIKHIEFGQGPSTGLTTIVADELDADWSQMRIEFAPANDALYKNLAFGTMGTGGSTAMANSWMQMRNAGAAARSMLVEAAANRWSVSRDTVLISKGVVRSGSRSVQFGDLVADAARLPVPQKPTLKKPEQWTLIGTDVPKIDTTIKSTGKAKFTVDVKRPGMVVSMIAHPPVFGGTVQGVDSSAALAVPGVLAVKPIDQGVVVFAKDTWSAMRGRAALKVDWDLSRAERRSSEKMLDDYRGAVSDPGRQVESRGDARAFLGSASKTLEAEYVFPFLAHAPMETLDVVIEPGPPRTDVWMGSQFQVGEVTAIASVLGVPVDQVRLREQFAGGSFGRRAQPGMNFAVEAAAAAKAYGGTTAVKHMWTRENDIAGGFYRPLVVHKVRAGLDDNGNVVAWHHVVAAQSFVVGTPMEGRMVKGGVDPLITEGVAESAYSFPNLYVGQHIMPNGVPALWWRSVGNSHTAFAMETFVDRMLVLGGKDPIAGRLALMKEDRARVVLREVAKLSGGLDAPAGSARGVAFHKSFGTYVAQVAEVTRGTDGLPKVTKVWVAVDCGVPINPNVIRAQMEGGVGFGLGHALYGEIELGEGGQVEQHNFDGYRSLRMSEMPEVEVVIVKSAENPTGVGEPGLPPLAPAVANAWRNLTGKVVNRLPFSHGENA
jgi:isoquinoline 1-oxidoreductase beta subunit